MSTTTHDANAGPGAGGSASPGDVSSELSGLGGPAGLISVALADLRAGAEAWHLWRFLGWQDIRLRYRRSLLGPFWLTASMGVLVAGLAFLYGSLLAVDIAIYLPYMALGFILWGLISNMISDGCTLFINAERIIKQVDLPLSLHLYRLLWRSLIVFCHDLVIFVVIAIIFGIWPGWAGLLAIPGLALLCLNGFWMALTLAVLSARFRDVPPICASVVRIAFFITPVIWMAEQLPDRAVILSANPFYHCLEVVRAPMLGQTPALESWLVVLGFAAGGWMLMLALFSYKRARVAYWI